MLETARNAYILFGIEPTKDLAEGSGALPALRGAAVVAFTSFVSDELLDVADVLLPIGTFAETAGTFVNAEGRWQSFDAAADLLGDARPGWRVLRVLGNELELPNCEYRTPSDVVAELERELETEPALLPAETLYKGSFTSNVPAAAVVGADARRADLRRRCARPPLRAAARDRARPAGGGVNGLLLQFNEFWATVPPELQLVIVSVLKIVVVLVPLILGVAYFTYWERKILAWMHARIGPNRVGWKGVLQPFADVIKMLLKEIVVPTKANRFLFLTAPVLSLVPAFAVWAVVPLSDTFVIADIDAGLLYVLALTSLGIYGVILAGWASNSKYAFLGAMRSAAQMVAYEIAMGFALVGVLMAGGSLNLGDIILAQQGTSVASWFVWPLFPLFVVYFISGVAETNRAPFDVAEGESEIVAGFHVEYSGIAFGLFFLAEYANMILITALTVVFFFGGWLSPFAGVPGLENTFLAAPSVGWLLVKMVVFCFLFLWFRATFPRYRYDQIMRLGWKVLIPVTIVWIGVEGVMAALQDRPVGASLGKGAMKNLVKTFFMTELARGM